MADDNGRATVSEDGRYLELPWQTDAQALDTVVAEVQRPGALERAVWAAVAELEQHEPYVRAALHRLTQHHDTSGAGAKRPRARLSHATVYTGLAGIALLYARLHALRFPLPAAATTDAAAHAAVPWPQRAAAVARAALATAGLAPVERLPDLAGDGADTLLCGEVGVAAAAAAALAASSDPEDRADARVLGRWVGRQLALGLVAAEQRAPTRAEQERPPSHELLYGYAGWIACGDLVNAALPSSPPLVDEATLAGLAQLVVRDGRRQAAAAAGGPTPFPLWYAWHGKVYLGAAHGLAGIAHTLLRTPSRLPDAAERAAVLATVDALLARCVGPSGNLYSSWPPGADRLVQWCHGAAGWVPALLRAAQASAGDAARYRAAAAAAADVVWARGVLTKGVGLCHGIGGNGYVLLLLASPDGRRPDEATPQAAQAWRRAQAFAWAVMQRPRWQRQGLLREPDAPYSLYEGLAGGIAYLADVWAVLADRGLRPTFLGFEV